VSICSTFANIRHGNNVNESYVKHICVNNSLKSTAYKIVEIFCIILAVLEKHEVRKNVFSTVGAKSALSKYSNVKSNTYWPYSNSHIIYKDFYITVKSGSIAKRVSAESQGNIYRRNKYRLYAHGVSYSIIRGLK
jgi:hypothetical protein